MASLETLERKRPLVQESIAQQIAMRAGYRRYTLTVIGIGLTIAVIFLAASLPSGPGIVTGLGSFSGMVFSTFGAIPYKQMVGCEQRIGTLQIIGGFIDRLVASNTPDADELAEVEKLIVTHLNNGLAGSG
jgi:hypothetical protein